jgi:hypothetical protein
MALIASGAIKPEAEIAVELGFPPFKVTFRLKAGDIQKLILDTRTVSDVLRRCFVQRRILRAEFSDETRPACIKSAKEIVSELRSVQKDLPGVGANTALVAILAKWENISVEARQKLQGPGKLPDILREYRVRSLPIIEGLISMLADDHDIRRDAEEKLLDTKRSLPGPDLARITDAWCPTDIM